MKGIQKGVGLTLISRLMLRTTAREKGLVKRFTELIYCMRKQASHSSKLQTSHNAMFQILRRCPARRKRRLVRVGQLFLVDHELLEGVKICWDQGAHSLIVIAEDLLPSALWAHRAGWPGSARVRSAVTLSKEDIHTFFNCKPLEMQLNSLLNMLTSNK